jgi:hypothetical protein
MHLSEHSLRQIDDAYLQSLEVEALRGLSLRLLADLKEARARLDAQSADRSRPFATAATPRARGVPAPPGRARRGHRDLPPARPRPVAHARTRHRRPARRAPTPALAGTGGVNGDERVGQPASRGGCGRSSILLVAPHHPQIKRTPGGTVGGAPALRG